jgi:hypothetical protein
MTLLAVWLIERAPDKSVPIWQYAYYCIIGLDFWISVSFRVAALFGNRESVDRSGSEATFPGTIWRPVGSPRPPGRIGSSCQGCGNREPAAPSLPGAPVNSSGAHFRTLRFGSPPL